MGVTSQVRFGSRPTQASARRGKFSATNRLFPISQFHHRLSRHLKPRARLSEGSMIGMAELLQIRLKLRFVAGLLMALSSLAGTPAHAQTSIEQLANDQGADRAQRLTEGAKREGEIVLYSSLPQEDNAVLAAAFE